MSNPQTVSLEEATFADLKNFAQVNLGLEVRPGTNGATLRGLIQKADATITEVPIFIPSGEGAPRAAPPEKGVKDVAVKNPVFADNAPVPPAGVASSHADPMHWSHDPKVKIYIPKTDDPRRPREVTIQINGVTFRMQRAVEAHVPYRVYEALLNATEKSAVDGEEVNPHTGDPIKVWENVQSYPTTVLEMPPQEEIDAWLESTRAIVQKAA